MKTPAFIKLVSSAGNNKHESVMELNMLPGEKTPWHYHTDFSETFEVLKGTLEVGGLESLTRYFAKEFAARKMGSIAWHQEQLIQNSVAEKVTRHTVSKLLQP